jgi:acetyltransferase-like isoleucine patch superfamily enzyme
LQQAVLQSLRPVIEELVERSAEAAAPISGGPVPKTVPAGRQPWALLRFLLRNRMITPKYARLLVRLARRRWLTRTGRRLRLDGVVFIGPKVTIEIGRKASVRLGRWVWIGKGTKIRCHEGEVRIGAKTVMGEECTISAYQHVSIGEQCVVADRVMLIDFDHNVAEVERPIRVQGIYKRDVRVGNNVWIGYGAQILRGVTVGDNAIIGASAVVSKDVPANAVVAGVPARVIRMREAPRALHWDEPVEPAP